MSNHPPEILVGTGPARLELHSDGVALLRLARADAANGLDMEMLTGLHAALLKAHGDTRVRALLLTGDGPNFCGGGDVHAFLSKADAGQLPGYIRAATALLQQVAGLLIRLEAPVVTAVQGYAAGGGGMGLVCSSDVVVAGESAKFLAGATRVAMVPDAGVSVTLTALVGLRQATRILMFNPVIGAAEALAMGLVTQVVPDDRIHAEALAMARQLAAGAPAALSATKRLLWSGLGRSVEAAMPDENQTQALLSGTADAREGLAAVIGKRAPRFTGR